MTIDPLICASAHAIAATAAGEMMYMPAGMQTITPFNARNLLLT
ncbi:MAG: hypothetical protein WCO57_11880 [Verrucomicrobiota bacterium]